MTTLSLSNPFETSVELPIPIGPWRKCQLVHGALKIQCVGHVVVPAGFSIEAVRVGVMVLSNPKKFPWPTLMPGQQVRITLANNTNAVRKASIVLHGTEAR